MSDDTLAQSAADQADNADNQLETRLAALLQQHEDSLAVKGGATELNEDLTRRLTNIETTLARLSRTPASTPQVQPTQSTPSGDKNADLIAVIEQAVAKRLEPVVQRFDQKAEEDLLLSKQRASMNDAVRVLPELRDTSSKEYEVWSQLLNGRPDLQKLQDAPYLAAELTRSLTADMRLKDKVEGHKKQQATAQPSAVKLGSDRFRAPNTQEEAGELARELAKEGETKGWTQGDMADYIALQFRNQGVAFPQSRGAGS